MRIIYFSLIISAVWLTPHLTPLKLQSKSVVFIGCQASRDSAFPLKKKSRRKKLMTQRSRAQQKKLGTPQSFIADNTKALINERSRRGRGRIVKSELQRKMDELVRTKHGWKEAQTRHPIFLPPLPPVPRNQEGMFAACSGKATPERSRGVETEKNSSSKWQNVAF